MKYLVYDCPKNKFVDVPDHEIFVFGIHDSFSRVNGLIGRQRKVISAGLIDFSKSKPFLIPGCSQLRIMWSKERQEKDNKIFRSQTSSKDNL